MVFLARRWLSFLILLALTSLVNPPAIASTTTLVVTTNDFTLAGVNSVLSNLSFTNVTIRFKPGTYLVNYQSGASWVTGLQLMGTVNRSVTLEGELDAQGNKPKLILGSLHGNPSANGSWAPNVVNPAHHWLVKSVTDANGMSYLGKLVIRDLELDGNFKGPTSMDGQGAWSSEANATGYKSFAIDVAARTGWITNVTVRNFGSVGEVPGSSLFNPAGVEAFVVRVVTFSENQDPVGSAPNNFPWIIEDVELTDFHSVHGGYGTMIMPVVYQANVGAISDTPVAVVRRCRLYVNDRAIAFGTAGAASKLKIYGPDLNYLVSGRIQFIDNLVVGAGLGFNTDSHTIGPMFLDNNAFLDVGNFGQLGQPSAANHIGFLLTNNLVRLRGWLHQQSWSDVCLDDYPNHATDPELGLGRFATNQHVPSGLLIPGGATDIRLQYNDFAAWPNDNFYLSNPADTTLAKYRVVWKVQGNVNHNCRFYSIPRIKVNPMVFTSNRVSGVAYDFKSFATLDSGTDTDFMYNSSSSHSAQHLQERSAVAPGSFTPKGTLRRVLPVYGGSNPLRLHAVREVQLGHVVQVPLPDNKTYVHSRVVDHRLRASGASPVETAPVSGLAVRLRYSYRGTNWTEYGPYSALGSADSNGMVTNALSGLNAASGLLRLTAWIDGESTPSETFEAHRDGWATYDFPLQGSSFPVVELTSTPDVGDDKSTLPAKRAKIRVARSGATNNALVVYLTLNSNVVFRPSDNSDLAPKYGTSGNADYYLVNGTGTWSSSSPFTTATLTIPAGLSAADAQVVTLADNLTEQNLMVCRLVATGTYSPGVSTNANILIFDGPLWTVQELSSTYAGYPAISSAVYAINEKTSSIEPKAGGYGTYYTPTSVGGYWPLPGLGFVPLDNMTYVGISTDPIKLVGTAGTVAKVKQLGVPAINLPENYGFPTAAYGIVSNASLIVGSGMGVQATKPLSWSLSGGAYSSFDLSGGLDVTWPGAAFGANLENQVVGEMQVAYLSGWSGTAAFRSRTGTSVQGLAFNAANGNGDILRAPGTSGTQNLPSRSRGISRSGQTVGWYEVAGPVLKAVSWPASTLASDAASIDLQAWKAKVGPAVDTRSEAKGINDSGWIVGWSGTTSVAARAVLRWTATSNPQDWIDLNDPHFVAVPSGWILKEATAINSSGYIVGNGTLDESARAFILIPRTSGN